MRLKAEFNTSMKVRSALVAVKPGAVAYQFSGLMLIKTEGFPRFFKNVNIYETIAATNFFLTEAVLT